MEYKKPNKKHVRLKMLKIWETKKYTQAEIANILRNSCLNKVRFSHIKSMYSLNIPPPSINLYCPRFHWLHRHRSIRNEQKQFTFRWKKYGKHQQQSLLHSSGVDEIKLIWGKYQSTIMFDIVCNNDGNEKRGTCRGERQKMMLEQHHPTQSSGSLQQPLMLLTSMTTTKRKKQKRWMKRM